MLLLRERRSRHRRDLPGDHLRQHRRNRLLPRARQLLPQLIQPKTRRGFQAPRSYQQSTGRGGTVSRVDMTHFLVRASGAPGTTAPVSATPPRSLYPLTIPHDRPTCHRNRHVVQSAFGYTRILGEMRKLGIKQISRQTVRNILNEEGIEPPPDRTSEKWSNFLERHKNTLWACDFFSVKAITARGIQELYCLVFLCMETREVIVSSST